jgi:hypothetical protein
VSAGRKRLYVAYCIVAGALFFLGSLRLEMRFDTTGAVIYAAAGVLSLVMAVIQGRGSA